jgi:hypothetical protein
MHVLLIQVDGKLPNLALMKLAHWHRSQGHRVTLIRRRRRDLFDPAYDTVYASAIFSDSNKFFPQIRSDWPTFLVESPLTSFGLVGFHSIQIERRGSRELSVIRRFI